MKPFTNLTEPQELDFFSIYTRDGVKYIHFHGYTYKSDSNEWVSESNPNGIYWANLEVCGAEMPLADFLAECRYSFSPTQYVNDLYEEAKQYQGDYDEAGIVDVINHYYRDIVFSVDYPAKNEGMPDAWLGFAEVTMDTPDGNYAC